MKFQLIRFIHGKRQTLGRFLIKDTKLVVLGPDDPVFPFSAFSLELPWRDNEPFVSRIPPGIYPIEERTSDAHGKHIHIKDVPDRGPILIHAGNFNFNTEGCPLPGNGIKDINGDGVLDVTASRKTLDFMMWNLRRYGITEIEIIDGDHTDLEELC